jgi:hypothetical protein
VPLNRTIVNVVKLAVSLAILAYLVTQIQSSHPETFVRLRTEPKNWPLLMAAWACLAGAIMLGWTRWSLLARSLGLDVPLRDAFRIGFVAWVLDFVAVGVIGGDVIRAAMLGHEQRGRWGAATATVMVDRALGLVSLAIVASIAVVFSDLSEFRPELRVLAATTQVCALAGTAAFILLLLPGVRLGGVQRLMARVPKAGPTLAGVISAIRIFGDQPGRLAAIAVLGFGVPCLNVLGFYLIAHALPGHAPSLGEHFLIIPLTLVSGVFPLPMEALGVFDWVANYLYTQVSGQVAAGKGFVVVLAYRTMNVAALLAGLPFYLTNRAEVTEVMHEVEDGSRAV